MMASMPTTSPPTYLTPRFSWKGTGKRKANYPGESYNSYAEGNHIGGRTGCEAWEVDGEDSKVLSLSIWNDLAWAPEKDGNDY